jgi:hypothetical protein
MTDSSTPAIWPAGALAKSGATDKIEISTRRRDGSLRPFVPIWTVAIGDAWYQYPIQHHAGAIRAAGQPADVTFTPVGQQPDLNKTIDDAYRSKYAQYGDAYRQSMLADQAVATTLQLTPQD